MRVELANAEATVSVAKALAPLLAVGDVVALIGDLGAGKTTFTAAAVQALGAERASSPTFALVNRYTEGRLPIWHVDLYRLERERELPELGLDDFLGVRTGSTAGVAFVEWADKFQVLPADHLRLEFTHSQDGRTLVTRGTGPRGMALAAAWQAVTSTGKRP